MPGKLPASGRPVPFGFASAFVPENRSFLELRPDLPDNSNWIPPRVPALWRGRARDDDRLDKPQL